LNINTLAISYASKYPKTGLILFKILAFEREKLQLGLSSVLNSNAAIEINRGIMRAFVAMRQLVLNTPVDKVQELQNEVRELKAYIEDVFADYNDVNEDTRIQLELINQSLAEFQTKKRIDDKPRRRIGFISDDENESIISFSQ
jgi:hypothetical protein